LSLHTYLITGNVLVAKTISLGKNTMSTRKVKAVDVGMVPFFVRFLEGQNAEGEGTETPSFPWTFKYPSDLEDK
jgi:hypothetical protein